MASHRDAVRLVLRTASPFHHQSNGSKTYSQLARRTVFHRTTASPSPCWAPPSHRPITSAAKRTSQQAAAAQKNEEPEDPEEQPSTNEPEKQPPKTTQQDRARIAQNFLTGSAPESGSGQPSQKPPQRSRNPLRDDSSNTEHGFTPTDISPEISERFSFLRNTQPPPSPLGQAKDGKASSSEARENTFQTLLSAFHQHRTAQGESPTRKSNNRADASRMLAPKRSESAGLDLVHTYAEPDLSPPSFTLGPRLPRTVEVNQKRGVDLMRAFKTMEVRLALASVREDMNRQRFHERPGLKRKRLASKRWRRRFKDNIIETVKRIHEIRKQGW